MKVIDLLNKIANGEEVPKKIKKKWEYEYKYDELRSEYHYMDHENKRFDEEWLIFSIINDEIEILDKEDEFIDIEELEIGSVSPNGEYIISFKEEKIQDKINEIIKNQKKIINKLKEEGKYNENI